MRYKAVHFDEEGDSKDLTEPKKSIEDVLKALNNRKPEKSGMVKYDSEQEIAIMRKKAGKNNYDQNWKQVKLQTMRCDYH